eukprot:10281014-Lingulodinium_polyedra.AAC.1
MGRGPPQRPIIHFSWPGVGARACNNAPTGLGGGGTAWFCPEPFAAAGFSASATATGLPLA